MNNYILQIDTATEVCSVSVSLDGKTIGVMNADELNAHASKLTVYIDELLASLSLHYSDLKAVAVSMGPGSYTGLRIGVSTAKGLCYALDIPLIAVNTLESMMSGFMESQVLSENVFYIPMLDARRMEVYLSVFDHLGNNVQQTEAVIVDESTFEKFLPNQVCLFGSGAAKLKDTFANNSQVVIVEDFHHSSAYLSQKAFAKFANQSFEDLIYFEPYYLKEFIATTPKKPLLG